MSRERYPGDAHRQIYNAWREYPLAMWLTIYLGASVATVSFAIGFLVVGALK